MILPHTIGHKIAISREHAAKQSTAKLADVPFRSLATKSNQRREWSPVVAGHTATNCSAAHCQCDIGPLAQSRWPNRIRVLNAITILFVITVGAIRISSKLLSLPFKSSEIFVAVFDTSSLRDKRLD